VLFWVGQGGYLSVQRGTESRVVTKDGGQGWRKVRTHQGQSNLGLKQQQLTIGMREDPRKIKLISSQVGLIVKSQRNSNQLNLSMQLDEYMTEWKQEITISLETDLI